MSSEPSPRDTRRPLIIALISATVLVGLFWRVLVWMVGMWESSPDYSHGYFVAPFAAFLLWSKRREIVELTAGDGLWLGLGLFGLAVAARLAGVVMGVITVEAVGFIIALTAIVAFIYGRSAWWNSLPAFAFLLFMVPPPNFVAGQLSGALQMIATHVSTFSLQTLGIPAHSSGNVITLTAGQIGVAEACSGLRMLYAFFALTVGAIFVIDRTTWEKVLIALLAIPIAILTNCIRIVATGLAFEYSTPEFAGAVFHDWAGWFMMPVGFMLLVGTLALLDKIIIPAEDW